MSVPAKSLTDLDIMSEDPQTLGKNNKATWTCKALNMLIPFKIEEPKIGVTARMLWAEWWGEPSEPRIHQIMALENPL